jgi:hypothetical protein
MVYLPHFDFYFWNQSSVTFLKLNFLKILKKDSHTFYLNTVVRGTLPGADVRLPLSAGDVSPPSPFWPWGG